MVNGETHNIGLTMLCDYMYMEGWDVMSLRTHMTNRDISEAIAVFDPNVVGLSVTASSNIDAAAALISIIKENDQSSFIIVGGQAFLSEPGLWQDIHADAFAPNGVEAASLLARLI